MGKMKELYMEMREREIMEEEMQRHADPPYTPKNVCFMHDPSGALVMLQAKTEQQILDLAAVHHLEGEFMILKPEKVFTL